MGNCEGITDDTFSQFSMGNCEAITDDTFSQLMGYCEGLTDDTFSQFSNWFMFIFQKSLVKR